MPSARISGSIRKQQTTNERIWSLSGNGILSRNRPWLRFARSNWETCQVRLRTFVSTQSGSASSRQNRVPSAQFAGSASKHDDSSDGNPSESEVESDIDDDEGYDGGEDGVAKAAKKESKAPGEVGAGNVESGAEGVHVTGHQLGTWCIVITLMYMRSGPQRARGPKSLWQGFVVIYNPVTR